MKLKNKIKLGAAALVSGAVVGIALNKTLDQMVKTHLSREGITQSKQRVIDQGNLNKITNSPESILGQLFASSTPNMNITIANREGRHINALLYQQAEHSSKYVILVHGYRSNVKAVSYLARRYFENGYNVLIPYLRAHQGSDYEYCTMGWYERFDIIDWINYLDSTVPSVSVVLHGVSMGAATVMMTTGEPLPTCVKCAIEDCGYTSVYDAYSYKIPKMMGLPKFAVDLFRHAIKSKIGFDIKEASALNQVRKSSTPTLFLHGDSDTVVPSHMALELYNNARCEKDILIFSGAEHVMSPLAYPDKYWNKVWEFIGRYI